MNKDFVDTYRDVIVQIATPNSTGTGFFLKGPGLIVTNHHVVEGNRKVIVEGARFKKQLSRVLYADRKYDLAFLECPGDHLDEIPDVRLGVGKNLRERDPVTALGHPFGLKFSVKTGIVSGTREVLNNIPYLHIDAALNPGNSGGPLVDSFGNVIGVNTAVILPAQGLCFAVASNLAKFVVGKLILEGRVRRGYIGIAAQTVPLPPKWIQTLELPTKGGIQIQSVEADGPANNSGLQAGDIIVQFEGKPIDSIDMLHKALDETTIGRNINLWVLRNGSLKNASVTPGELK